MTREEKIAEVRAKLDAAYDTLTAYRDAVMWTPDHHMLLGIVSDKLQESMVMFVAYEALRRGVVK